MKVNDWVADLDGNQIGKVKEFYREEGSVDIILYDRSGEKIGRESPAGSGPKSFEPCCSCESWVVIEKPTFPLPIPYYLNEIVNIIKKSCLT